MGLGLRLYEIKGQGGKEGEGVRHFRINNIRSVVAIDAPPKKKIFKRKLRLQCFETNLLGLGMPGEGGGGGEEFG